MSSKEDVTIKELELLENMIDCTKDPPIPSGGVWFEDLQSMLKERAANDGGGFTAAWDVEGTKWFGLYPNSQVFYDNLKLNPVDKGCGYEVIPENTPCRLYVRAEWNGPLDTQHEKVRRVCTTLNKQSREEFERNPELFIYCCSEDNEDGTFKNCYMIVSTVLTFFCNHDGAMQKFVNDLCKDEELIYQDSNGENKCFVDLGIYEKYQCILLPYCSKLGSPVRFQRIGEDFADTEDDEPNDWAPFLVTNPATDGDTVKISFQPLPLNLDKYSKDIGKKRKLEDLGQPLPLHRDVDTEDMARSVEGPGLLSINKTVQFNVNKALHLLSRRRKDFPNQEMSNLSTIVKRRHDGNKVTETYTLCKRARAEGKIQGRLYPVDGIGFCLMQNDLRACLLGEFYWDIDIKQAHPTFFHSLAEKYGLENHRLGCLVKNRDELFRILNEQFGWKRDQTKLLITRILFQGPISDLPPALLEEMEGLKSEIRAIAEHLSTDSKFKPTWESCKKKNPKNPIGAFINSLCVDIERGCLLAMDEFLLLAGRGGLDCLIFDGGLCKKALNEKEFPEDLLRRCEEFVEKKTGQRITLVVKPMQSTIVCDDMIHSGQDIDYQIKKIEFEQHHFKVINRAQFLKFMGDNVVIFSKQSLLCAYQHLRYDSYDPKTGDCETKSFIDRWLQDPQMRMYEDIDNCPPPLVCPDKCYNMWSGFAIQKRELPESNNPDFNLIMQHRAHICNKDQQIMDWVDNAIAHMIQKPGEKFPFMMVLKAGQGQGKNLFFDCIKNMVGEENSVVIDNALRDLFGTFNGKVRDKLWLCLNEGDSKVNNKYIETLKQIVTDPKMSINDKNDKVFTHCNLLRVIMFTNNLFSVKIAADDRRFFAWECSQPTPSMEYFNAYANAIANKDALRLLFEFYLRRDISRWNPSEDRPVTDLMIQTKELSLSAVRYWAKETAIALHAQRVPEVTGPLKDYFKNFQQSGEAPIDIRYFSAELREMIRFGITGLTIFKANGQILVKWEVEKVVQAMVKKHFLPDDWETRDVPPSQ